MLIIPFVRRADGTATPDTFHPTTLHRMTPPDLKLVYGGQQVQPQEVHASPPEGYAIWQGRDGRLFAFSMADSQ